MNRLILRLFVDVYSRESFLWLVWVSAIFSFACYQHCYQHFRNVTVTPDTVSRLLFFLRLETKLRRGLPSSDWRRTHRHGSHVEDILLLRRIVEHLCHSRLAAKRSGAQRRCPVEKCSGVFTAPDLGSTEGKPVQPGNILTQWWSIRAVASRDIISVL